MPKEITISLETHGRKFLFQQVSQSQNFEYHRFGAEDLSDLEAEPSIGWLNWLGVLDVLGRILQRFRTSQVVIKVLPFESKCVSFLASTFQHFPTSFAAGISPYSSTMLLNYHGGIGPLLLLVGL